MVGSLSLLRGACQRRNHDSRLGGNGLVGEWGLLVGTHNTTHQQHFLVKPCASAHKYCITAVWCVRRGGCSINVSNSLNCKKNMHEIKITNTKKGWLGVCAGGGV